MTGQDIAFEGAPHDPDLFGPDPGSDPLAYYAPADPAADIFASSEPDLAARWRRLAAGLVSQGQGDLVSLQDYLDRHVQDLGLAFRLTGDERERPWPLNPMPILIGTAEWQQLESGLVQRAELLEKVIADLYGPQNLVAQGHLPAPIVSGSTEFARRMVGLVPPRGHFLHVYGVDLARGPSGEWRVLADRVRLPVGIGYSLENRLALNRLTGGLLASIGVRQQAGFFDALRKGIAERCVRSEPRIALLTAGRYNQSYPEQAHLARHLGFSLVEGRDLIVRDERLYVRTIAGLKRIDALWRWIRTRDIDPLNFDARSEIGVPGLIDAASAGLVVGNWPGVGVVESRAMPAFLPRLAQTVLGEPLRLPNAATWWCGGEQERAHVLANLDQLVISSSFRQPVRGLPDGHTRAGASLSAEERAEIEQGLALRPMDYTAQEIVSLSTTPALSAGRFDARGFTLRAFLARDEDGKWVLLQGGFARVSQRGDLRTTLMGLGDLSADLCIVDAVPPGAPPAVLGIAAPSVRREQGLLPSQVADNLFWIGRYGERAHQSVRIVRAYLDQISQVGSRIEDLGGARRLHRLLVELGAVPSDSGKWDPARLVGTALGDAQRAGSVRALARRARDVALLLRDRLNRDSWRAIQRGMPPYAEGDLESMAAACDSLVEQFAALRRLLADGMGRGPAWLFLDTGICLERGAMIVLAARALVKGDASQQDLSALLDLVDGQSLYRSRYLAPPFVAPVLDMVLLDPAQPRGLAFQLDRIADNLAALPVLSEDGMIEPPLRLARGLRARVESLDATAVDIRALADIRDQLATLSDMIARRYFLQYEEPAARSGLNFLA